MKIGLTLVICRDVCVSKADSWYVPWNNPPVSLYLQPQMGNYGTRIYTNEKRGDSSPSEMLRIPIRLFSYYYWYPSLLD